MKEAVEVLNKDSVTYTEKFGDEVLAIPAGGKIVMNRREAVKFLGGHAGMDPKTGEARVKNLEIIAVAKKNESIAVRFVCPVDGLEFTTQSELDEHIRLVHPGQQFKDDRLEKKAEEKKIPEGSIVCPLCKAVVKNKTGLKIHLTRYCQAGEETTAA